MRLNTLSPKNSRKPHKRVGRGIGSGSGKTATIRFLQWLLFGQGDNDQTSAPAVRDGSFGLLVATQNGSEFTVRREADLYLTIGT